jgi:hypothetical protein
MIIHQVEQKSKEWFDLKILYPLTASKASAIATAGKGLRTLCMSKMAEKYSTAEKEYYSGKDTQRGVELEPQAIAIYELKNNVTVEEIGFVTNEAISPIGGVSPDGHIGEDGMIEVKCNNDEIHFTEVIELKTTGKFKIESGHLWQMQMQMLFTGRKWCDYVRFNPNYKDSLLVIRVEPDLVMQQKLITGLKIGENIIKEIESKLK